MLNQDTELKVHIHGVVIPTWLAACLLLVAVISAVSFLLSWRQQVYIERELRVLQLHTADIQNVLIRQGVATRDDFAEWKDKNSTDKKKGKSQ